jgi:hypothetical protein
LRDNSYFDRICLISWIFYPSFRLCYFFFSC